MQRQPYSVSDNVPPTEPENLSIDLKGALEMEKADTLAYEAERNMKEREKYFEDHPEVKQVLTDFMSSLLIQKPEKPLEFARNFFLPYLTYEPTDKPINPKNIFTNNEMLIYQEDDNSEQ